MTVAEFPAYVAYFVPDYAAEISANYDLDPARAQAQAEREIADELTQGVETPDQVLLCAVIEGDVSDTAVGYIWCRSQSGDKSIFINDFYVMPACRGKGFARAALQALETTYAALGYREIRLRVAADNARAKQLYEAAGFRPTGINMRKAI